MFTTNIVARTVINQKLSLRVNGQKTLIGTGELNVFQATADQVHQKAQEVTDDLTNNYE